jgi:hypothetical protein
LLELEAFRLPEDVEATIWTLDRAGNMSSMRRFAVRQRA